jgi:hypothetical protein
MVIPELIMQPEVNLVNAYDEKYKMFIEELQARKIIQ